jgi:3-oxoacyl-[acyl-carrier protein] reductase
MNIDFSRKKVFITGGTRGIGQEIARQYKHLNATVVITGVNEQAPQDLQEGIFYEPLQIDHETNWVQRIDAIIQKYDGFDICINNAGINKISKIFELEKDDLDTILLTNLNAPIYIASAVSKKMIENRYGFIINIASIFGVVSKEGRNPYTASKSGLIGVTKTMAIDLGAYNILVNAISPGFVDTELTRRVLGKAGMDEMKKRIPLNKLANVSDIVPTILFLTSDYNSYITGQNIIIDGGFTLE